MRRQRLDFRMEVADARQKVSYFENIFELFPLVQVEVVSSEVRLQLEMFCKSHFV